MATLLDIRTDLKRILIDKNARYLANADLDRLINLAQDQFTVDTESFEKITGLDVTASVGYVTPPSDFIRPRAMIYKDIWPLSPIDIIRYGELWGFHGGFSGVPIKYEIFEGLIRLWPAPSESSPSTTLNDPGGISATETSVTLTSGAAFPTSGMVIFEPGVANEEIAEWFQKDSTGDILKNLRRPNGKTHADGTTAKASLLRMAYYARPKKLSADADVSDIPDRLIQVALYYAANLALLASGQPGDASNYLRLYSAEQERMLALSRQKQRQQPERALSVDRYHRIWI